MTSTLRISYPDITRQALTVTPSSAFDVDHNVANLITGRRSNYAQLQTAAASITIDYDLGSGLTAACDHFIIGRADLLQADLVDNIYLRGDDNSSFSSPENAVSDTSWSSDPLTGPDTQDYISTFSTTTAYRYWRVEFSPDSGTTKFPCSNIYFGTFYDPGVDPDAFEYNVSSGNDQTFEMSMGNIILARNKWPKYTFNITWVGVNDANTAAFREHILKKSFDHYVYLYTTNAEILADNELVYCKVLDQDCIIEKTATANWNIINAVFEQVVK